MNKEQVFEYELNWIKDDGIRNFVRDAVSKLPDYFFTCAASSTGKYHPSYALGDGGLVRHTKAAVALAKDLLGLEMYQGAYTPVEKDLILAALILHDGMKHGLNGSSFTVTEHPVIVAEWIVNEMNAKNVIGEQNAETLSNTIASHMGQWNYDYKSKRAVLPKPSSKMQKFVHQCDYLASRKYLEVNFDAINYTGDRV